MTRLFLILGVCLLAITLTTSTASAEATIVGPPEEFENYYALFFPDADAFAEAIIFAPNPTNLIEGSGEAYIRGIGANRDELRATAISGAGFTLSEPHFYAFEGRLETGVEIGTAGASAVLLDLNAGPIHLFQISGNDSTSFLIGGPLAILPAGDYYVRVGTGLLPDERAQRGDAVGNYEFRLLLRPVPEPTSMALLASGALVLCLRRRKKQRIHA